MDIKIDRCKLQYGVPPRPHWVTAYYGIQVRVIQNNITEFYKNLMIRIT